MAIKTTFVEHSGQITFKGWNWTFDEIIEGFIEELLKRKGAEDGDGLISERVREIVTEGFEEHPPELSLPAAWGKKDDGRGGRGVEDPLTIYVSVEAVGEDCAGPEWSATLADMIDDALELHRAGGEPDGDIGDEGREIATRMRDRLRGLADKLDMEIKRGTGN